MAYEQQIVNAERWIKQPRFNGIIRLYTPREIAEQQGTIATESGVARDAAEAFYERLRELFAEKKSITTFGPYSPGQAVAMKRMGIEGIYLGGWATSAKGSITEDPGPDLASYPLSQVPDEAAPIVRALLTADRNQHYNRSKMSDDEREQAPEVDYRPFIIADADTGHGGDAHVRNLVRRFVEVGVTGYHIEDQKPGVKKCGHQGGKVLVSSGEQIKRLNAARFQLDTMGVAGIIVARTDAESATFLDERSDERDQPFILGATNTDLPSYKLGCLAIFRKLNILGVDGALGHKLFSISDEQYAIAEAWLDRAGITPLIERAAEAVKQAGGENVGQQIDSVSNSYLEAWQAEAGLKMYATAVADAIEAFAEEGETLAMTQNEWLAFARSASHGDAMRKAESLGVSVEWDCELPKTPEGYYQIAGGIAYAIAKSLAAAPFTDLLWMETKTANLADAKEFADAIHAVYPDKMLAYNLSPSFNWDTTGMSDAEMQAFPIELGKMGFVFNFITYGGHQIDGLAGEDFSSALLQEGMLALAKLQRKFRLVNSPYRTPQSLVGGSRADGGLMATSGRTATTKAMSKLSTQHQHLVQTEVPTTLLDGWIGEWAEHYGLPVSLSAKLRPHRPGSELLELQITNRSSDILANVVFAPIKDRRGRSLLTVRDQNTFDGSLRQKRLMTLINLFLIHRYKADATHYVAPTDDNRYQTGKMQSHGIFSDVNMEVGDIIVAKVDAQRVADLLMPDGKAMTALITKGRGLAGGMDTGP